MKKSANEKLVYYIKQYMNMFGYYTKDAITHYSDQTIVLCGYYDNCITSIKNTAFTDFTTPIDRKKGRQLEK